jgi:predicted PurR-regulated permease PerM
MRWAFIGLGIALGAFLLYINQATVVILSISFFIAYLLDTVIDRCEALGLSRTLGILLLAGVGLVGLFLLFLVIIPQLQRQTLLVIDRAPRWGQWLYEHMALLLERLSLPVDVTHLQQYGSRVWSWVEGNLPSVTPRVLGVFQYMFAGLTNFIVVILNIILVPVLSFYLLRDIDTLRARFYEAVPPHWRPVIADWLGEIDYALGGFLRGQFTIAVVLAALYAVGLALIGVPMGALLGVISGLANMVPYMSIVVGLLPALLLFFLSDEPGLWRFLGIIMIYIGGQLLEGVYLGPRIMGKETGLHPVIVMVAILVGGTLFGLLGIMLAVPATAVLQVALRRWHRAWRHTWPPPL